MKALGERMTLALSTPLIGGGLVLCALADDWPHRAYGAALVICASLAMSVPWRSARGLAFGVAALAGPILGVVVR
jgi:hypothetical protein